MIFAGMNDSDFKDKMKNYGRLLKKMQTLTRCFLLYLWVFSSSKQPQKMTVFVGKKLIYKPVYVNFFDIKCMNICLQSGADCKLNGTF